MVNQNGYKLYCCGSRGSRSIEGRNFSEFGGYTSCYILSNGDYALVIDCGTGFYSASPILAKCTKIDLVLTHMHYDHILGFLDWGKLPKKAKVTCYGNFKEWYQENSIKEFFKKPFWPICPNIDIKDIPNDGDVLSLMDDIKVQFYDAPHPDSAKLLVVTNGEITEDHSNQLVVMADCETNDGLPVDLIKGCNMLVYDGMFDESEYKEHEGWGHSTWQKAVELAKKVKCEQLIVTHHDPNRIDADLRQFERQARKEYASTDFARAGQIWEFPYDSHVDHYTTEFTKKQTLKEKFEKKISDIFDGIVEILADKSKVMHIASLASCAVLGTVSAFMTVVNIFTEKRALMFATLIFAIMCLMDVILILLVKVRDSVAMLFFQIEIMALFTFFVVSGTPEGFSIIWLFLLPTAGLFIFGIKLGSILCAIMFAILVFFLQIPAGTQYLMFNYSDSFRLRFPMAFAAFYVLSLFLEIVRQATSRALDDLRKNQDVIISSQTEELRDQNLELMDFNTKLEMRNKLLNKTFGRFLPDKIVEKLLSTSEGFELGGKKCFITALQSDIRGFTAISSHMDAMDLVSMLNNYLGVMTNIVQKYNGIVVEFMGDGILAVFGAPDENKTHSDDAIAAAVEMQVAMPKVNEWNKNHGFPVFEIGIGVHSGDAVLGTMGSEKHLKYDVIGSTINMCSRIESYSTGGQILTSKDTLSNMSAQIVAEGTIKVMPKGSDNPMEVTIVKAILGKYNLVCPDVIDDQSPLTTPIQMRFVKIVHDHCEMRPINGEIISDSKSGFTLISEEALSVFDNIRIECGCGLIGKVVREVGERKYIVRYTSAPSKFCGFRNCNCPESEKFFKFLF